MHAKKFALVGGWIMLGLGIFALIPGLSSSAVLLMPIRLNESYGLFFGLLPMNILNKAALIILGVVGLVVSSRESQSIAYARTVAFITVVLAILGLFSATNTLGGYWPLYGGEVLFHAVLAAFAVYYGYSLVPSGTPRTHSV